MKLLVLALCVAFAATAPTDSESTILRSNSDSSPEGGFQYAYETSNNIAAEVVGTYRSLGKDEGATVVKGSYQHTAPNGEVIQTVYVADENGFQPQGAHLPTPPPTQAIPQEIQRALAYIAANPSKEKY